MGLFSSLKGNHPSQIGGEESSSTQQQSTSPQYQTSSYDHPPLKSHHQQPETYAPPPGPPPSHAEYAPPPGPPPSHWQSQQQPPPYHDWTSVPDTALLPPPPSLHHDYSSTSNASLSDAERAYDWCKRYPLVEPHVPAPEQSASVKNGDISLHKPGEYNGTLSSPSSGHWKGSTHKDSKDCSLVTTLPLYFVMEDSPLQTETPKTIYFEVKIKDLGHSTNESAIALGYCAVPYPTWRLPGWQRGSLAVHSDDGRRYVSDADGGRDFTASFKSGETIGLGVTFKISEGTQLVGEAFLTRNGKKESSWSLQEETDAENEFGNLGTDGRYDLYAAIGTYGSVEFEADFKSSSWLFQPPLARPS